LIELIIKYEVFGYMALIFNLLSYLKKEKKEILIYLIISSSLFILNMVVLKLPIESILIVTIGLFVTVFSLLFIENEKIKKRLIKASPLVSVLIIYLYDFSTIGIISGVGFLFATIAKLQNKVLFMKIFFLLSTLVWLGIMIFMGCTSFIVFYICGAVIISFSIFQIINESSFKKTNNLKDLRVK
jgi:hypothetical protein